MTPYDAGAAAERRSKAKRTQMACRKSSQRRRKWVLPQREALPGQTGPTPGRQGGRSTHRSQQKDLLQTGGAATQHAIPPPNTLGCSPSQPRFRIFRIFSVSHWNIPIVIPLKTLQHAALDTQSLKSLSHLVTLLPVTMLSRLSNLEKPFDPLV